LASVIDKTPIEMILVGDSLGMTVLGQYCTGYYGKIQWECLTVLYPVIPMVERFLGKDSRGVDWY
jgi:hypothetical protein